MTVIDVHTHMLDREWLRLLRDHGAPRYGVGPITEDLEGIYRDGALFMTPMPGHFDYDLRLADMDAASASGTAHPPVRRDQGRCLTALNCLV